jgi:protein-tyrosine phosphatase
MRTRDIELERTFNVRDLGGYVAAGDLQLPWRRLLRGAGLHRLDGGDASVLRALELRTVLDLRTPRELERHGRFPAALVPARVVNLPMIPDRWDMTGLSDDTVAADYLYARYVDMLSTGADAIAGAFEILGDPARYPAMLFCAGGKDRTGVLAALLLATLGVDDETIAADYALSEQRLARLRAFRAIDASVGREAMVDLHPALAAAPAEAMARLLAHVRSEHGSVAGFLESIGVARTHPDALRAAVLASDRSIARSAPGDQVS